MPLTSSWAGACLWLSPLEGPVLRRGSQPHALLHPALTSQGPDFSVSWCRLLAPRHRPRTHPVLRSRGLTGLVPQQQAQPAPLEPGTGGGGLCSQLEGGRGACLGRVLQRRP